MEQYPVDGVIAESWAATNVGAPVKMKMIDNSNLNAFTATNTSEMVVSGHTYMGSDPSQFFSYGSGLTNDGQASVRKGLMPCLARGIEEVWYGPLLVRLPLVVMVALGSPDMDMYLRLN